MVTKRKRWPNHAEWARLDAIALSEHGRQYLQPIFDKHGMPTEEMIRRAAKANGCLYEIERVLKDVRDD